MPKAKPTQVITHRIEAGEWERQNILRPVADMAKITKSVQAGAITVVCLGVGAAGYSAYWFLKWMADWGEDAKQFWENTMDNVVGQPITVGGERTKDDPYGVESSWQYRGYKWVTGLFS